MDGEIPQFWHNPEIFYQRYPCPAWVVYDFCWGGAGQKPQRGQSPVCTSLRPSPHPILRALSPLGPILTQILPNNAKPSYMAQIYAERPKSKHNGPNPSKMAQIWSESRYWRPLYRSKGTKRMYLGPDLGHFAWIWAIILEFGPFCLELGPIAWIRAIWQNLSQNRPQRRQSLQLETCIRIMFAHMHWRYGNGLNSLDITMLWHICLSMNCLVGSLLVCWSVDS